MRDFRVNEVKLWLRQQTTPLRIGLVFRYRAERDSL
jgi:hypothetical protein